MGDQILIDFLLQTLKMVFSDFSQELKVLGCWNIVYSKFMVSYKYNNELDIIEAKISNSNGPQEFMFFSKKMLNLEKRSGKLKIKLTIENCILSNVLELNQIWHQSRKLLGVYNYVTIALISQDPRITALSILYKTARESEKYRIGIFSTEMGGKNWLLAY